MVQLDEKYNFKNIKKDRGSGILLHISSLPGPYGIGSLGKEARDFVDLLKTAGQKYWQILPVGPTSYGDSPYASFSTFAGNPYFIDLDYLVEDGLLSVEDLEETKRVEDLEKVDYEKLYNERIPLLRKAFSKFNIYDMDFISFCSENLVWLDDYSLFMSLKKYFAGKSWQDWPNKYRLRDKNELNLFKIENIEEINFQKFLQYKFFQQWKSLKDYTNAKGIKVIGDLPIYVAEDSSDVWTKPQLFQLKEDLKPKFVGGCPPDGFSDDGQLWGNPVYDWENNEKEDYKFWVSRIKKNLKLYDILRLDHFRGFESYWKIPAEDTNARRGHWELGPGIKLFNKIKAELGDISIIAEDLGYMTKEVFEFREATGFPSMKVLQFAFNPDASSDYLPHNMNDNCVVYTGTHDNDTIIGWTKNAREEELDFARKYLNITDEEGFTFGLIRGAMTSVARTAIFQMQDLLFLDNSARMNNPGKLGGNWTWRMTEGSVSNETIERLRELTRISGRL